MQAKYWSGNIGECQLCHVDLHRLGKFVDGKLNGGPWAIMCVHCHQIDGAGIGVGRGQQYVKVADGRWLKIAG